jgi:hypothetical protein
MGSMNGIQARCCGPITRPFEEAEQPELILRLEEARV